MEFEIKTQYYLHKHQKIEILWYKSNRVYVRKKRTLMNKNQRTKHIERYFTSIDKNSQYCRDVASSQLDL